MPVDSEPLWFMIDPRGQERVVTDTGIVYAARVVDRSDPNATTGYRPHWVSCPAADRFRTGARR